MKNVEMKVQKGQNHTGISAKLRNKTNGIVERNQWNRSTKSMGLFDDSNGIVYKNWRFRCLKMALPVCLFGKMKTRNVEMPACFSCFSFAICLKFPIFACNNEIAEDSVARLQKTNRT